MTKDVNLNSDTWTKMTGTLTAIAESGTATYSSASVSSAYQGSYSSGKAGFAKRIDDLVKISEKAKNLIAEKDTDGVVSFSYHDDRESATTLQVSLGKLERYSSNVSRYVKEKIDQPFYEAMDKVGARLEALSIRSYTTTNTVGFKKTEVVVDATGSRLETREVRPQTIGLSDLYQVESPYKTALARSYEQFKASETYKEHKLSQDDYLMAMHHTRAFVYESIDDQKESLEFWRDLTLSTGVVILTIFCPPAGAAAGFVLAGAEMYSATTGKDWGTGRELDTTERSLRAGFALFDLIPGVGYINDLAKSGSKVAAKEFIQTSIQKGMAQGAKNLDSFKQVLKHVKGFGDTILTNMDTYAKQVDHLVKSKVSSLADNLAGKLHHADEAISEAARNFRLNLELEPQLVDGVMSSSSSGKLSSLADNLHAFAKNLDGSVDEVGESTSKNIGQLSKEELIKYFDDLHSRLSLSEIESLRIYSSNDYVYINNYMRGFREDLGPVSKDTVDGIRSALNKMQIPQDMTLYRGTDISPFEKMLSEKVTGGYDWQSLVGKTYADPAFLSTSIEQSASFASTGGNNILWEINAPKGTSGGMLNQISVFPNEMEFLLNSNTTLLIKEVVETNSGVTIRMNVIR